MWPDASRACTPTCRHQEVLEEWRLLERKNTLYADSGRDLPIMRTPRLAISKLLRPSRSVCVVGRTCPATNRSINQSTRCHQSRSRFRAPLQRDSARAMSWICTYSTLPRHAIPYAYQATSPTPHNRLHTWRQGGRRPAYYCIVNRDSCIDGIKGLSPHKSRSDTLQIYKKKHSASNPSSSPRPQVSTYTLYEPTDWVLA